MSSRSRAFRIVFLGTSTAAVVALEALIASEHEITTVYTKPDRKSGRGRRWQVSPVKHTALAHGLLIQQPERWDRSVCDALIAQQPELAVVVAYGMILPEVMLNAPRLGCVNLHTSLLPRWRGAAPVARAIEAGDTVTGVSLMRLMPTLDTGPIVAQRECPVAAHDTAATLGEKLAQLGAAMLNPFLKDAENLLANATPQSKDSVRYAHKLAKHEAAIDWRRPAVEIERKVRALNPWPVAQMQLGDIPLRIWESEVGITPINKTLTAGRIITDGKHLAVECGCGTLIIKRLQPASKPVMSARAFLNGHRVDNGTVLSPQQ